MKWFRADDFSWNGIRQPYRVIERHPHLVHIDPHLQVICFEGHCHPTWWPNFHSMNYSHAKPPPGVAALDWRRDAFAFHFTWPVPPEFRTPAALFNATGLYAEMGQMILRASDMLKHLNISPKRSAVLSAERWGK